MLLTDGCEKKENKRHLVPFEISIEVTIILVAEPETRRNFSKYLVRHILCVVKEILLARFL